MALREGGQAAFCSASACFSAEEWTLLQEWQKELYGNVMKEIHRALMSLGPLIATTVYTLRDKDQQDVSLLDKQHGERRRHLRGQGDAIANSPELSGLKQEGVSHLPNPGDLRGTESMDCLSTGHTSISFCVKDEDAACCLYRPEIPSTQIGSAPTNDQVFPSVKLEEDTHFQRWHQEVEEKAAGKEGRKRQGDAGHSFKGPEQMAAFEGLPRRVKGLQSTENVTNREGQMWSGSILVLGEEETIKHESAGVYPQHFEPQQGPSGTQSADERKDSGSHVWNANPLTFHPIAQIHSRPFECTECKNLFKTEMELTRHQRTHLGERPFHCAICEMSFIRSHHLIQHQRSHTGERPYQCHKCKQRFSLKGNLNKHQRKQTSRCTRPLGGMSPNPSDTQP